MEIGLAFQPKVGDVNGFQNDSRTILFLLYSETLYRVLRLRFHVTCGCYCTFAIILSCLQAYRFKRLQLC